MIKRCFRWFLEGMVYGLIFYAVAVSVGIYDYNMIDAVMSPACFSVGWCIGCVINGLNKKEKD